MAGDKRVVELVRGGKVTPDKDIVDLCKELLRQAEAGEIRGVAVAIDGADDRSSHGVAFADRVNLANLYMAIGMLRSRVEFIVESDREE